MPGRLQGPKLAVRVVSNNPCCARDRSCPMVLSWEDVVLLLLLLLLLVETRTAAQHSCHMLQVRDFKGTLLGIGSKVWRDVSSWTSCRCGTQVLVGLFWRSKGNSAADFVSRGVETITSFEGGLKSNNGAAAFVSRVWQRF